MNARDLMTEDPGSCRLDHDIDAALGIMDREECGAVPIIDERNHVIGIVTDRDILFGARKEGGTLSGLTVESCMTKDPITVREDDSAEDVIRVMTRERVRRVPVVDRDGKLRGIIAQADVAIHVDDDALVAKYLREVSAAPADEPAPER
jgi:CBS domain-containing protein